MIYDKIKDHKLKSWFPYFESILLHGKRFEYRINDRDFKAGETLHLQEFDPDNKHYTGRNMRVIITKVWVGIPGLPEVYCILEIEMLQYWHTEC